MIIMHPQDKIILVLSLSVMNTIQNLSSEGILTPDRITTTLTCSYIFTDVLVQMLSIE
jgi:hypothetical protein